MMASLVFIQCFVGGVQNVRSPIARLTLSPARRERDRFLLPLPFHAECREPAKHMLYLICTTVRQNHEKFIASSPDGNVRSPNRFLQSGPELLQHEVPSRMPKGVIDLFEVVQIKKQHR